MPDNTTDTQLISFKIPLEVYEVLRQQAFDRRISMSELIREAIYKQIIVANK